MSKNQPASQKLIMKLQFEELGVIRRAALNLLPNVQDPEYRSQMQFSRYKSSRKYKFLSDDNNTVTLEGGYRLCRATRYIPVDQCYFWEVDFTAAKSSESHVRIGISTIQADMEAPVGVDSYGYCVADLGKSLHRGWKNKKFQCPLFKPGDTVGIGFAPNKETSKISLHMFLNGSHVGVVYDDISPHNRWIPAISIYRDATVTGRFLRPFKFDPGPEWRDVGSIPPEEQVMPITADKLVSVMKGKQTDVSESEREMYMEAIDASLIPAHQMPI